MALNNYNLDGQEIVISPDSWHTTTNVGNYSIYGAIILRNRVDTGSGWRYTVMYGWRLATSYIYWTSSSVYATLSGTIGGVAFSYSSDDNKPGNAQITSRYAMFSGTTTVTIPYGASLSGSASVTVHRLSPNYGWSYGGSFNVGVSPPPPIPSVPISYGFEPPTQIGVYACQLYSWFEGNAEQRNYYKISLWNANAGSYIANPAYTSTSGNREYYQEFWSGLNPETTYTINMEIKDPNNVNKTPTIQRTFTTLSYDRVYIKRNNAWVRGLAYIKVNGSWRKGREFFIKRNGAWVRSKAQ